MNINDFLPLLLKGSNPEMGDLLSGLGSGDSSKMMDSLLAKAMGGEGKGKELLPLIKMMQQQQKTTGKAVGFSPIYSFVPKDILGIMVKYFSKY